MELGPGVLSLGRPFRQLVHLLKTKLPFRSAEPTRTIEDNVLRMHRLIIAVALVVAACSGGSGPTTTPSPTPAGTPHLGSTEGCPPAFWAQATNFPQWEEHRPDEMVGVFFSYPEDYAQLTLADALLPTHEDGGQGTLIRQAIAAILNAAHDSLEYPYSRFDVGIDNRRPIVPTVAELLRTGTPDELAGFAAELAAANELGCPLD